MKQKLQKRMTRLLTALLVVAVTVCFVPQTGTPVYAANGDPAMVAGAESVLKATANTDNAQTVWYAGKAWRVISFDGTGNGYTKQSGAMTLFSSDFLASNTQFNSNWQAETANDYAGSDLQNTVNDLYDSLFSTEEKEAVNNRTLSVGEYTSSYPYSTGISGTATSGYLWPLSTAEAFALPTMTFRSAETDWWLRSPGGADYYTAIVYYDGIVSHSGYNVNYEYGARPAFYLNLSSVLFTSAAEGGKSSGTVGAESLTAVLTNSNSEWKVTLLDSGRSGFAVSDITPTATGVSLKYSGAKTGTNEYVSAVIMDSSDTIKYYGRVKACAADADTSDTIEIKTDGILGEDDKLYVFNEQYNGDKMTDYASELVPVAKDYTKNWGGSGSENDPYVISNTEGWNDLAEFVAAGGNTEGIYFAMGDDISVTESVGTGATPFAGVFDGKGHTLTFNKTATGQSCAPFSVTSNAAFRNLHIDGSIETNHKFAGGLIGTANGSNTVTNCRSSIVILSSIDGDGTHGGFVGRNNVTYEGCVFDGKIIGEKTTSCGAFQGWNSDDSKCTNCISDASEMNTYLTGGTFIRNGSETNLTNCYYMQPIGQGRDHGKQAYSVIASNGVSIGFGEGTKYDVSGITAYSTGLEYKGVFYAGKEEQIDLTMPDLSSQRKYYVASAGELIGSGTSYTLVMPDEDVVISTESEPTVSIKDAKVVLSAASFTYNTKVQKPTIKTIKGLTLKAGTDYTVKWSNASSKDVGSYTITITGKGKYTGTTKATYKINPKGTSLKSPKKAKKAATVKWKKQAGKMSKTRITGYQIQLATDSKFTQNKKNVTVKGYKKVSKKVTKLKGKKKYYIRIRTYKTVSGQNYYSPWSKVKTVTTKK